MQVDVGFDACVDTQGFETVADRFFEPDTEIEGLGADRDQEPAQRVLHFLDGRRQLVELGVVSAVGAVVADALELQLGRRQQLQRIVVQGASEPAPGLVTARGDIGQELASGSHRLSQPLDGNVELLLGLAVLPDETGGHRRNTKHPGVVGGEAAARVVGREGANPPIAGRPRDGYRVAHPAQAVLAPELVELGARAVAQLELVMEHDSLHDGLAIAGHRDPETADR